jgi:hypothetical protein
MCEVLEPKLVINYAKPFDEMYAYADLLVVPYEKARTAPALERSK